MFKRRILEFTSCAIFFTIGIYTGFLVESIGQDKESVYFSRDTAQSAISEMFAQGNRIEFEGLLSEREVKYFNAGPILCIKFLNEPFNLGYGFVACKNAENNDIQAYRY